MKQEYEIEYKNLLTLKEYEKIRNNEFVYAKSEPKYSKITQWNYYFDTENELLKNQGAALRIRVADLYNELTFKVPVDGFFLETNIPLDKEQVEYFLSKRTLSLSEVTTDPIKLSLDGITNQTIFNLFNSFKTIRLEKQVLDNLIVLDQTTFQNGVTDYELEVESIDPIVGQNFINSFLDTYSIPTRLTSKKIARAEKNK